MPCSLRGTTAVADSQVSPLMDRQEPLASSQLHQALGLLGVCPLPLCAIKRGSYCSCYLPSAEEASSP